MQNRKRDTDVQNRLGDSVGEGEGGIPVNPEDSENPNKDEYKWNYIYGHHSKTAENRVMMKIFCLWLRWSCQNSWNCTL